MNDLGNLSNMSNLSSFSNAPNTNNTGNNSIFSRQSSNPTQHNTILQPNPIQATNYLNYFSWQYYLSMLNFSAQQQQTFNKIEPDLAALSWFNKIPELQPQNLFTSLNEQEEPSKKTKNTKSKAQNKHTNKQAVHQQDTFDEKKVLETLNEIDFDFLEYYQTTEDTLNCKRKGVAQSHEELIKKLKVGDPLGVE